jgi:hypothetical protein
MQSITVISADDISSFLNANKIPLSSDMQQNYLFSFSKAYSGIL